MIGFQLTPRDRDRLAGVHPHLISIVTHAASVSPERFVVLEGLRTSERQRELFAKRATRTLNSRHLTGHAVDIAPLLDEDGDGDVEISWHWEHFRPLADLIKRVAGDLGIPIIWGGDWVSLKDGPHWELPRQLYPANVGENGQQVAEGVTVAEAAGNGAVSEARRLSGEIRAGVLARSLGAKPGVAVPISQEELEALKIAHA